MGQVDIYGTGDAVRRACWWGAEEAKEAEATPEEVSGRSRWQRWGGPSQAFTCRGVDGAARWSLTRERRGFGVSARLRVEGEASALEEAADPLWTVGRLGREGLAAPPAPPPPRGALTWRVGAPWPRLRLLIDDAEGELWATLEAAVGGAPGALALRRWDGRRLAWVTVEAMEEEPGLLAEVAEEAPRDALERAAVEAAALVLALFELTPPPRRGGSPRR